MQWDLVIIFLIFIWLLSVTNRNIQGQFTQAEQARAQKMLFLAGQNYLDLVDQQASREMLCKAWEEFQVCRSNYEAVSGSILSV
jgi:hypothetical protein